MAKINDSLDRNAALEDILNAVAANDNNHVEVINRLDKMVELLERIAVALEEPPAPEVELREISPALAEMYREGRVS